MHPRQGGAALADLLSEIREAGDFGLRAPDVEVDYPAVQARREKSWDAHGGVGSLFKKNGIDVLAGEATLGLPPKGREAWPAGAGVEVRVGEEELEAATVILATGSVGRSIPGVELGGRVIGTEQAWALPELPRRLAVVGAGASGAEIASGFARLGSEVLLFEVLDRVLPSEDADISRLVERGLKRQGIEVSRPRRSRGARAREGRELHLYGGGVGRGRLPRDRRRAWT